VADEELGFPPKAMQVELSDDAIFGETSLIASEQMTQKAVEALVI
jgi:hypothetical protein